MADLETLLRDADDLERELIRLQDHDRELLASLGEFDHQSRRFRDALERAGGRSRDAERALERLKSNQDLAGRDRTRTQGEIDRLQDRLAAIRSRIADLSNP